MQLIVVDNHVMITQNKSFEEAHELKRFGLNVWSLPFKERTINRQKQIAYFFHKYRDCHASVIQNDKWGYKPLLDPSYLLVIDPKVRARLKLKGHTTGTPLDSNNALVPRVVESCKRLLLVIVRIASGML
ncbi:hypothetical protein BDF20DRAFT_838036 [Mycotypha africana]|uniref:uncharacterized protein n=1 Tax=Mycotypha africana TaxID=64632 RepID=UPI002300DEE3|nr:uncharacterized protein BDF20DRAFT_838036 [Mycotypha africana]KAI8971735.1 hypothetical protein BDF20DRAFT_838036 [Mycotypha africana]